MLSPLDYFVAGLVIGVCLGVYAHRTRFLRAFKAAIADRDALLHQRNAWQEIANGVAKELQDLRTPRKARRVAAKTARKVTRK